MFPMYVCTSTGHYTHDIGRLSKHSRSNGLSNSSAELISYGFMKLAILPCDRREGIVNELTKLVIPVPDGEN